MNGGDDVEDLDSFRLRARAYIHEHIPRARPPVVGREMTEEEERAEILHQRKLQRILFDGGLAGIVVPKDYGGQGLTPAHSDVLNDEMAGRDHPLRLQVPGMTPCMTILLDFGTEEQKKRHIPAILRGDEIWMQMLSEPSGGSDVAGAQTTAVRDGDEWVLNGSKIWTTGAWWSDWALCLTRTNFDTTKHRGLTVFMVPFTAPGLEMHQIEMLNGSKDFCQEFLTDVRIPDSYRIGDVDDGWTVGTRWMYYERSFTSSPHALRPGGVTVYAAALGGRSGMLPLAVQAGRGSDPGARELVGEAHALGLARTHLQQQLPAKIRSGRLNEQAASIGKLMNCVVNRRTATIAWQLAGANGAVWSADDGDLGARGMAFLNRQAGEIGGGTVEMARNVVSERVLGLPRERTLDRDRPFRDIPKGPPAG